MNKEADPKPIERALFRETEDGNVVYFPWGLTHRGYRLTEPGAKAKATRAGSLLIGFVIAIGTWTAYALQPVFEPEGATVPEVLKVLAGPGVALGVVILAYYLWTLRFVERFPESDLRISREDRLREAAIQTKPWKIALIGVVTMALSGLLIWLQPNTLWLGILGMVVGAGVLYWSVVLKRAASP